MATEIHCVEKVNRKLNNRDVESIVMNGVAYALNAKSVVDEEVHFGDMVEVTLNESSEILTLKKVVGLRV